MCRNPRWAYPPCPDTWVIYPESPGAVIPCTDSASPWNGPLSEPASRGVQGRRNPHGFCSVESSDLMPVPRSAGGCEGRRLGVVVLMHGRGTHAWLGVLRLWANPPLLGSQCLLISQTPLRSGCLLLKHKISAKLQREGLFSSQGEHSSSGSGLFSVSLEPPPGNGN